TLAYPAGQAWGAVFLTVGAAAPPGQRRGQDLTACSSLKVDMRRTGGSGAVAVGLKDTVMPDDGSEKTVTVPLTSSWQTKSCALNSFTGVDRRRVYELIEFVFAGNQPLTVAVRNLRLVCG